MKTKNFSNLKQIAIRILKLLGILILISVLYAGYFVYPFLKKNTVILRMSGGLGNQLFQYSAAYAFAKKTNSKLYILFSKRYQKTTNKTSTDRYFDLYKFGIKKEQIIYGSGIERSILKILSFPLVQDKFFVIKENNFFSFSNDSKNKKIYLIEHWFQDIKHFINEENEIKELFNVHNLASSRTSELVKKLQQKNSVCIHVRLGDWVKAFGELDNNYYNDAVKIIEDKIKDPRFYVFSDEPEIAKEKFKDFKDFNYMNNKNLLPIDDFFLLANCTNTINSASTFNWWSSFLNSNPEKVVIAPIDHNSNPKGWIGLQYKINPPKK